MYLYVIYIYIQVGDPVGCAVKCMFLFDKKKIFIYFIFVVVRNEEADYNSLPGGFKYYMFFCFVRNRRMINDS